MQICSLPVISMCVQYSATVFQGQVIPYWKIPLEDVLKVKRDILSS